MTRKIVLSPVTRIEGHLAIHTQGEPTGEGKAHRVTEAHCEGEMFRGFETVLQGRDPLDAQQFVQRICGVCPIAHGMASCLAQDMAYGIRPTLNGRLLRNLISVADYIQSHITHFYHLSALDFVDVTAVLQYKGNDRVLQRLKKWVADSLDRSQRGTELYPAAPFLPRYEGDYVKDVDTNCALLAHYVEALDMRRIAEEMAAVFCAKLPHSTSLFPGGVTQAPTLERILAYRSRLKQLQEFVNHVFFGDVVAAAQAFPAYWDMGKGYGDLLSYGMFEMDEAGTKFFPAGTWIDGKVGAVEVGQIREDVGHSRFSSGTGLHPARGATVADPRKAKAYTWIKAPRYGGRPMEVGPLARVMMLVQSAKDTPQKKEAEALLKSLGLGADKLVSVLGRHLCRVLECKWLADQAFAWIDELEVDGAPAAEFTLPKKAEGYGLTEASRGALGHWISIEDHKISNYQCVVPTTWNCSPRDDAGKPGPVEKALEGVVVADPDQPLEVGRVVRSFDPCLACAIH